MKIKNPIRLLRPILASLLPLVAFSIQWMFWSFFQPYVWFLFYPAVFFSAWIGGLAGGLAATIISTALVWFFFIPPEFSFVTQNPRSILSIGIFMLMGILFSFTQERLKKANRETVQALTAARSANEKIEERVQERTAELAQTNKLMQAGEERFRMIIEGITDYAIYLLDTDGRVESWNKGAQRLKGYRANEIIGQSFTRFFTQEDQQDGKPQRLLAEAESRGHVEEEGWRIRKDGSRFLVNSVITALRNEDNSLYGFAKITRDITERKQAEELLARSEKEFRLLADSALIGIYRTTLKGEILYVNETMARVLGFDSPKELMRAGALARYRDPADRQTFLERLQRDGKVEAFETVLLTRNGQPRDILMSAALHSDQMIGNLVDITERKQSEITLQNERDKAIQYFDTASVMMLRLDRNGNVSQINRKGCEVLGYSVNEIVGKSWFETVLPRNTWQDVRNSFEEIMKGNIEGVEFYENPVVNRNGEEGLIEWHNALLRDADGKPIGTLSSGVDITERKQAEATLKVSESRYRRLFEAARDGILILDAKTGTVQSVNPYMIEMLGFPEEKLLGKELWELGFFKDIAASKANFLELQKNEYIRFDDLPLETANGRKFHVEFVSNVYQVGADKVIQCNLRDITERKRAEIEIGKKSEQLQLLSAELEIIIDSIPGLVFYKDTNNRFVRVNKYMSDAYKMSKKQLEGVSLFDLHPSEQAQAYFEDDLKVIRSRQPKVNIDEPWETETGTRWVNTSKVPRINEAGEVVGVIGISIDVTERKRAEEDRLARETAERANLAKSEFLSRMSHELRTPMNSILGFAQLLKMDELTPDQMDSLEQILKSGRHLLTLINEVLDIARIESGKMSISPEPVQLDEVLHSVVNLIRPLADQRGVSIEMKIPSSRDIFVTSDRQRLTQALLNLLSNGIKYNREGGRLYITASLLVDGFLHLAVRDTGAGIPPEKMNRLFVAFDRLELQPDLVEGTGLGLALSKGLIEAMGGRIGAESVVGEGSTFWIDLQLTTQQKETIVTAEVDDYLKDAPGMKKGLVLYVEDNLSNIQLIEKILARLPDVELISAMQGSLALDLARTHKPALILLDIHLPDMNGDEALRRLRADAETKDIPVVIMSADATHGQIERMLAAGANAYLTKPIDVKEFLTMVGEQLAG